MPRSSFLYNTTRIRDLRQDVMTTPLALLLCAASNYQEANTLRPARIQPVPALPATVMSKAADPGGFIATHKWSGEYRFSWEDYHTWLSSWCPDWAGTPDLLCVNLEGEGRNCHSIAPSQSEIQARQDFTTEQAHLFFERWPDTSWAWVPTIQGYSIEDYKRHAREMAPLIQRMWAFYHFEGCYTQLLAPPDADPTPHMRRFQAFRVGIGSLVGRASPEFIREVVLAVRAILGEFLPFHLWGVKLSYLKAGQQLLCVISYDTSAFDERYSDKDREKQKTSGETQGTYLWKVAQPTYGKKVQAAIAAAQHQLLFPDLVPQTEPINIVKVIQQWIDTIS